MLKHLLESKRLDVTVNVCPFATCVKKPSSETDADGGKVEVRAPDAYCTTRSTEVERCSIAHPPVFIFLT
jgi:hypothetical protein